VQVRAKDWVSGYSSSLKFAILSRLIPVLALGRIGTLSSSESDKDLEVHIHSLFNGIKIHQSVKSGVCAVVLSFS